MRKILIHDKSEIEAEGRHVNGNSVPIICLDTGEVFTSMTDAADKNGVTVGAMSFALKSTEHTCKGKHYCRISEVTQYLSAITQNIRSMEEKAKAYDTIVAEQNAKIRAEELRQEKLAKANEKLAHRRVMLERIEEQARQMKVRIAETEREIAELSEINEQ